MIIPPVGKSGPGTCFISCEIVMSLLLMKATVALIISPKLWGGILVAIPTAIPPAPFTNIFGYCDGSTSGSFSVSS